MLETEISHTTVIYTDQVILIINMEISLTNRIYYCAWGIEHNNIFYW